jgi:hypothetical protein
MTIFSHGMDGEGNCDWETENAGCGFLISERIIPPEEYLFSNP